MWPFKKKKTREQELAEVIAKVGEILKWMQKNECYPPSVVNDLKKIMDECKRIQKEIEYDKDFNRRYYHK
jgi:chorismate mutase